MPDLNDSGQCQCRQGKRLDHREDLRDDEQTMARPTINHYTGKRTQQESRKLPGESHRPQQQGRLRQAVNQPRGGDLRHPGAQQRNDLAAEKEPATLGTKRILHSNQHSIWLNNAEHIQQFNGRAVNVLASDTTASNQALVAERKIKKTVTTQPKKKEPEKKPGFFKRLFGKKNKD